MMIGHDDLATIHEVWQAVAGYVWDRYGYTSNTPENEIDVQSLFESTSDYCWEFLKRSKTAKVILPNGKSTPAKTQLFDCSAPWQDIGVHLSLKMGTVGSGNAAAIYGKNVDVAALYGVSHHCFIYVSKYELETFAVGLSGSSSAAKKPRATVSERIIEYHDKNPWAKKSDIIAAVKETVSVRQFEASWKLAAKKRPALSAGGRPKSNKPEQ